MLSLFPYLTINYALLFFEYSCKNYSSFLNYYFLRYSCFFFSSLSTCSTRTPPPPSLRTPFSKLIKNYIVFCLKSSHRPAWLHFRSSGWSWYLAWLTFPCPCPAFFWTPSFYFRSCPPLFHFRLFTLTPPVWALWYLNWDQTGLPFYSSYTWELAKCISSLLGSSPQICPSCNHWECLSCLQPNRLSFLRTFAIFECWVPQLFIHPRQKCSGV